MNHMWMESNCTHVMIFTLKITYLLNELNKLMERQYENTTIRKIRNIWYISPKYSPFYKNNLHIFLKFKWIKISLINRDACI